MTTLDTADTNTELLDPRLVLLSQAAARLTLFDLGKLDLDGACEGLIDTDDSFERACESAARQQKPDQNVERLRRLLDEKVSLDRAYAEMNNNTTGRTTPEVTVEAIKVAVRERGVAALSEPTTRERLQHCDAAALTTIDNWLIGFEKRR